MSLTNEETEALAKCGEESSEHTNVQNENKMHQKAESQAL